MLSGLTIKDDKKKEKKEKEIAGIMSSCHFSSPCCWPTLLLGSAASLDNGPRMSYCGCDFTRKNNSSNHSWKLTLNALPRYESASFHIRMCDPRLCVCVCASQADSKVYLRWMRQLSFLGKDERQTFEVSTISVFMLCLWRKETAW